MTPGVTAGVQSPPAATRDSAPEPITASTRVERQRSSWLRVLVCLAALAPIVVFLWVALHRVGYPFELDWMEGGSVELAARVVAGHGLYAAPSLEFVGWTYPPLYYWIAAAVAKLTGVGFLPLRLVSLAASLMSMATLGWIVTRETGDRVGGLVAAGLFAATFRISGAWFDTGRVDSLFLALTLLALARGRWAAGARGGILLGVLAFLAFFTKQVGLIALAPMLIYLAVARRRVGIPAALTTLALVLASTVVLDASSHGWYRYYVLSELAQQPWAHQVWLGFWVNDILGRQWPLVILLVAGGATAAGRVVTRAAPRPGAGALGLTARDVLRSPAMYYAMAAAGLVGAAWISRLHTGGYANVLMPAYAAIALLAGLTYARLAKRLQHRIAGPLLAGIVLLQLWLLAYPIGAQIPTSADRTAGNQLIARLRALPGPVIVLRHPWYATEAGKGTFAQEEAIGDVLRSASARGAHALRASLRGALAADNVQAVVLDGTFDARFIATELARDFRLAPRPITPLRLYPLTDVRTAPSLLYVRVHPARSARAGN